MEARPSWRCPPEYEDLLTQERVLGDQARPGPEEVTAGGGCQRGHGAGGPQEMLDALADAMDAATHDDGGEPDESAEHVPSSLVGYRRCFPRRRDSWRSENASRFRLRVAHYYRAG